MSVFTQLCNSSHQTQNTAVITPKYINRAGISGSARALDLCARLDAFKWRHLGGTKPFSLPINNSCTIYSKPDEMSRRTMSRKKHTACASST